MNKKSPMPVFSMTRTAIQNLLHFAIASPGECEGLLFVAEHSNQNIVTASLATSDTIAEVVKKANERGLHCIGKFHLEGMTSDWLARGILPEAFVDVSVSLAEEGRLDLNAKQVSGNSVRELSLVLIEDGQLEVNA